MKENAPNVNNPKPAKAPFRGLGVKSLSGDLGVELRILSPTAILGYGFPMESFEEGMKRKPHVIAVDAGSTDPGPFYLGAGKSFTDRNSVKRDLEIMIPAALEAGIPVIVGTAGGCGGRPHVEFAVEIVMENKNKNNYV